mmetsp:Transcript_3408/g.8086  ORF Transcript_3408/g.8086 Transcript_3408/m.8086 type:complete len:209 (-) Transcript_3408:6-632(-)
MKSKLLHDLLEAVSVPVLGALLSLAHACLSQHNPVQVLGIRSSQSFEGKLEILLCVAGRFEDVHRVVPCILASLGTLQACKRFVATTVFEVGVCFCIEEELGLEVHIILDTHMQSRLAVEILRIDIGTAVEQEACQPHVAILRSDVQGKIAILSIDGCCSICHGSVNAEIVHNLLDFLYRLAPANGGVYLLYLLLVQCLGSFGRLLGS